jgi:hypothetical protein
MEEPHIDSRALLSEKEIAANMQENDGFLELDFVFERCFKEPLAESSPKFFEHIKDMTLEQFVQEMMQYRENTSAFDLLKQEYLQSLESIEQEKPVPWKEMLASLSYAMNYPAKHFSAEDMLRLRKTLLPLISVVIAFVPQKSCESLLALHDAGCLKLVDDKDGGDVEIDAQNQIIYKTRQPDEAIICETFIDCIGQKQFRVEDFPFKTMVEEGTISGARIKFRSSDMAQSLLEEGNKDVECEGDEYFLHVAGIAINDDFQVVDSSNQPNGRIYIMAVPYIGGFNPDYSGLDFCEQASKRVVNKLVERIRLEATFEPPLRL